MNSMMYRRFAENSTDGNCLYRLPLQSANRIRYACFTLGVLSLVLGGLILRNFGWPMLVGALFVWFGLYMLWRHGVHGTWLRNSTNSPNSCAVNSLSICLDFVGYPWDARHLEEELQLNEQCKGTRLSNLVLFPRRHGIEMRMFSASSMVALREALLLCRSPMIAMVPRPIPLEQFGWGIVVAPLNAIDYLLRKYRSPQEIYHAVVIHGVVGDRVAVYDPAFSTSYRVRFSWLKEKLVPYHADSVFMAIPGNCSD